LESLLGFKNFFKYGRTHFDGSDYFSVEIEVLIEIFSFEFSSFEGALIGVELFRNFDLV